MKKITLSLLLIATNSVFTQEVVEELATINSGSQHCSPTFKALNNVMFFDAGSGIANGVEPWSCNTATGATSEFKDINLGFNSSNPYFIAKINNKLLFSANNGTQGLELWTTDGTVSGTQLVKDINIGIGAGMLQNNCNSSGPVSNNPKNYGVLNGKLIFEGFTGSTEQLWISDGTNAGTTLLKQIDPNPNFSGNVAFIRNFTNAGGKLFFIATTQNIVNSNLDYDLWVTDGTTAGTMRTKDINLVGNPNPQNLTSFNNKIFFTANDGVHGIELWSSDGTTAGTIMVSDINLGTIGSNPSGLFAFNDKLFFLADNGSLGNELWVYNATTNSTSLVKDTQPGAANVLYIFNQTIFDGMLYFMCNTNQLWKTDGTTDGTTLVKNGLTLDYNYTKIKVFTNKLYFGSNSLLWSSDGTTAGTLALPELPNTVAFSNIQPIAEINGKLVIALGDYPFGSIQGKLWTCDSSQNITYVDANGISSYGDVFEYNNALYFEAFDTNSPSLYRFGIPVNLGMVNPIKKQFRIYPNPASNFVAIQSETDFFTNASITFSNIYGQIILKKEGLNSSTINLDVSSQTSGIYFLTVENQGETTFQKIIKN
jgi:trimeric autotransporter adhesin